MDLNAKDVINCEWTGMWTDGRADGLKTGRLYRTLLKQVRQKKTWLVCKAVILFYSKWWASAVALKEQNYSKWWASAV